MNYMFNLDDYEDVAARVLRFQKLFPEGRIVTDVIQFDAEKGFILVSAQVYRNATDTLPAGVDYAFGDASTFNTGMRKWYVEDTCSSAIGRSLSLVLETQKKPTKQNMAQVNSPNHPALKIVKEPVDVDYWNTSFKEQAVIAEIVNIQSPSETCDHGAMEWKTGEKNGKQWGGFMCPAKSQTGGTPSCQARWYVVSSSGKWEPQKARV
jgi:hypothetical protein